VPDKVAESAQPDWSLAAWAVASSIVAGAWLPFLGVPDTRDADGICGPVLVFGPTVVHFEQADRHAMNGHCLFCHWRASMANAFAAGRTRALLPLDDGELVIAPRVQRPDAIALRHSPPRGPPTA
jgi:hypothetical protein